MRTRKNQESFESPDMTPMLDIVFIMLIFFIVTTSFVKESGVDWTTPVQTNTPPSEDRALVINIDAYGMVEIRGRQIDVQSVQANVESALVDGKFQGAVIRSSSEAASGILVSAVDQVKLAGIQQVQVIKQSKN